MTSGRPYQGYPYVNPVVTDAPSLSAAEVANLNRWRDLPTKKITTQPTGQRAQDQEKYEEQPKVYIDHKIYGSKDNLYPHYPSTKRTTNQNDPEPEPEPTIYIDLPEDSFSGSSVSEGAYSATGGNSTKGINRTNGVNGRNEVDSPGGVTSTCEDNDEIEPVVYINIPESNESDVTQSLAATESEPDYAEQTIYYNPFKEKKTDSREEEAATSSQPGCSQRPLPPSSLDLPSTYSSSTTPNLPTWLSKEAYVYGRQPTPEDDFSLSPIPLNEYHQAPPSYEEAARTFSNSQGPEIRPDVLPPRTQVIVHNPETHVVGHADLERKLLYCQHCSKQVNTLVVRENGILTHVVAWAFMCTGLFPITVFIYCTDIFKYRNHYCPNCNKKIGHEIPFLCRGMQYV